MNKGKKINWGMIIAGTLLAALLFGACQQPVVSGKDDKDHEVQGTTGELLLVLGDEVASRTLFPDIDMNTASYRITGSGPEGGAFDFVTTETMELIDDLTFGDWTITVEALNAADAVIGRGSAVATVEIGETAAVAITVEALSGFGTLTLDVSWPAADVFLPAIQASLMPISGVERTLDFTVDKDAGTAVFSAADVEAGYYTLTLKLTDRGQLVIGAVELVWMAEGAETAGTFAFTDVNDAQGSVDITIEPGMTEPFDVTINGAPSTLAEDELAFLSTTVPAEVGPCLTFWYLNGLCRSTDAEWSFAGADYGPGFYRLDVVMISADFTLGGSASMMMEITEDTTAPTIVSITPADGAVDVPLTDPITIVFSDSMDADTLNSTSISLTAGGTPVAATLTLSPDQKTVTLTPDAGLGWLTEYVVTVADTVADLAGNGLVATETATFTTMDDTIAPGPVTDCVIEPRDSGVFLSWTNPLDADFDHVVVGYSLDSGATWTAFSDTPDPAGTIFSGLTNGTEYLVRIWAVDQRGNYSTGVSALITPDGTPPPPVSSVTADWNGSDIELSWTLPADVSDVYGTRIDYRELGTTDWITLDLVLLPVDSYTVTGLDETKEYEFSIRTRDLASNLGNEVIEVSYEPSPSEWFSYIIVDNEVIITGMSSDWDPTIIDITIPYKIDEYIVTTIDYCAFQWIGFTSIDLPRGLTSIGAGAFSWNPLLTSITLPKSIESIGNQAFGRCTSLSQLTIKRTIAPSIEYNPFIDISNCTLRIPTDSTGYDIFPWSDETIFSSVETF